MTALKRSACFYILFYLSVEGVVAGDITCTYSLGERKDDVEIAEKIYLTVFKGNSRYPTSSETALNPENIANDIDVGKPSIIYIHGFMEDSISDNVQIVVKAYLDRGDVNVIVADWSRIAININYYTVARKVAIVGKTLAESIERLSHVIDLTTLHIIGHSLGAHVAGFIGRSLKTTLKRITALDAAFPLFYPSLCHVRRDDADIVVALHTDGGFYGTPVNTGTIDFFANTGRRPQPGCSILSELGEFCSHQTSVKIYSESIRNPKAFPARKCANAERNTRDFTSVYFGDSTPENVCGTYCFTTNPKAPYGKGDTE